MSDTVSSILFVDDDADVQRAAAMLLGRRGFCVTAAQGTAEAWAALAAGPADVVLLDLNFSRGATTGEEGLAFLRALVAHDPETVVVVVTGHSGVAIAVAAMRCGAADFVMKPWHNERLVQTLTQAAALRRLRRAARPAAAQGTPPVIGDSPAMQRLMALLRRAAPTPAPVLLAGERGTGKSLLAHTLHLLSAHAAHPLVTIDPASLWESGTKAWAHAFEAAADAGMVFLDEPGGLSAPAQAALLRRLEALPALRVVSATRQDGPDFGLRPDLLCRLNVVELRVPKLAQRPGDVRLLAGHFLRVFANAYGRPGLAFSEGALAAMQAWPWPGQVRELRQVVERAVVLGDGPVLEVALSAPGVEPGDLNLARLEKAVLEAALRRHAFNVTHAARDLGLSRAALYRRMARHGF